MIYSKNYYTYMYEEALTIIEKLNKKILEKNIDVSSKEKIIKSQEIHISQLVEEYNDLKSEFDEILKKYSELKSGYEKLLRDFYVKCIFEEDK